LRRRSESRFCSPGFFDASAPALDFAARHHVDDAARHRHVVADAFAWTAALPPDDRYDVVIVDPPAMTSRAGQVGKVLATYRALFARAAAAVAPGGTLVTACCTSSRSRTSSRCRRYGTRFHRSRA